MRAPTTAVVMAALTKMRGKSEILRVRVMKKPRINA